MDVSERIDALKSLIADRILIIDGAMGTQIQARNLGPEDFGGEEYEGCNEYLNITRPDIIAEIHRAYLEAGADILETNTFGATALVLGEYGLAEHSRRINREAALIARTVSDEMAERQPGRRTFVAGAMGPTTRTISVTGGLTFDELAADYHQQAAGLIEGGVDMVMLETSQDTINVKAGLEGIDRAFAELGITTPVAVQGTVEPMGTLLAGQDAEALYTSLAHRDLLWVGFNCATGPEFMTDHVRTLSGLSQTNIACVPNAGLPDEDGNYNESPEMLAATLGRFAENGWLNVAGGCCGTGPDHIRQIAAAMNGKPPRDAKPPLASRVSGIEAVLIDPDSRPTIIGERTKCAGEPPLQAVDQWRSF